MTDSEHREPTTRLLLLFFLFGVSLLAFDLLTLHSPSAVEINTSIPTMRREEFSMNWWLQHGYFHSAGMKINPDVQNNPRLYRSVTGGSIVSGFLVVKLSQAITGHPNWRLMRMQNEAVSMLAAVLLGLLGYRLSRRFGVRPLHAFALALMLEAVYFTFPDNLWIFWEMTPRAWWLPFACIFLLADEARLDRPSDRGLMIVQAAAAFLLTYMEHVAGAAFIASYVLLALLLGERRPSWRQLALVTIVPMIAALVMFQAQFALAKALNPELPVTGAGFMKRTGLDGETIYYNGHLDIAHRRDIAARNFAPENIRPLLFQWPWLFFTSVTALAGMMIAGMRGRVPRPAMVSVLSLLGAYLLYAAVFSEALVVHPYYYDMMLFTPLMIALFVVVPSLIEPMTREQGVIIVITVFFGIWLSWVQMRDYAVWYPQPPEKKVGHGGRTVPRVEQWTGVPLPQPPESAQEGRALSLS
jgi:hypothetical protein